MAGVHHVFDTSFSRTFSLLESQREFVERFQRKEQEKKSLPMMTSACPGDPTTLGLAENTKEIVRKKMKLTLKYLLFPKIMHFLLSSVSMDDGLLTSTMFLILKGGFAMQKRRTGSSFYLTLAQLAPLNR